MNVTNLVGRVGRTPSVKVKEGQTSIANFSLATDEYYGGENHTTWHNLVCFGKVAEYVGGYVSKGSLLEITGRLQTREWVDKDDNKRQTTEIIVNTLKSLTK
jgi:single-strand DNA-binding protein